MRARNMPSPKILPANSTENFTIGTCVQTHGKAKWLNHALFTLLALSNVWGGSAVAQTVTYTYNGAPLVAAFGNNTTYCPANVSNITAMATFKDGSAVRTVVTAEGTSVPVNGQGPAINGGVVINANIDAHNELNYAGPGYPHYIPGLAGAYVDPIELSYNNGVNSGDAVFINLSIGLSCEYANQTNGTWSTGFSTADPKNLGNPSLALLQNSGASSNCTCGPSGQSTPMRTAEIRPNADVGNPINAATGNKFQAETDFVGAANTGLGLRRYYNSQDVTSSAFGAGWHSTWHRGLNVYGIYIVVTRDDGQQDTFTNNGSGVYTADPDVTSVLTPAMSNGTQTGWMLTLADDSIENYTLTGQLSSIIFRSSLTTALAYNASNQLATVTGPFGHTLTFTYDSSGRVATMTAPDGGVYTYAYDANNNLASVTYPDTKVRTYQYQNTRFPHLLTGIVDEKGVQYASWAYDSQGRATSSQHAAGADLTTVAYNSATSSTATDARGDAHTYALTTQFDVVKPTSLSGTPYPASGGKAFAYDAKGFISSRTDFDGNVTTYMHNAKGEETSRTEASGTALARTITTTWHATFHLPTKIVEPNRTTTFAYDAKGNLLTKTVTAGTKVRTEAWTYNANGQVLTAKDPDGHTTTYTYDAKGDVATIKDALGHVTKITSYDADGRPLSMADPNGLVTTLTYDKRGRLLTRAMGAEKTSYAYDAAGNLTKVTSPDGSSLTYSYDPAHRLTGIADKLGNHIAYTLDAAGNLTKTEVFDPGNALARTRSGVYNALNLLAQNLGAQGQTTAYAYDDNGNLTGVTDPLGNSTKIAYDALNRLVRTTDPNSGVTGYAYNANDRLTGVTDPRNLVTSYAYDGLDNQTRLTSPDAGATAKTYDATGNVTGATDARGVSTTNTYDALNRLTKAASSDGTIVTYQYDQGTNGLGHLTSMVYPGGSTSWSYNVHGRVLRKQQSAGTAVLTTSYSYDAAGRLAGMVYPSGRTLAYAYDASGRVSRISVGGQTLISNVAYEPFGPVAGWTTGNGTTYERVYDADGAISDVHWATGSGATRSASLAYDAAQQVTSLSDSTLPLATFDYDALGRLTKFLRGTTSQDYTYDAAGNRLGLATAMTTTAYQYASGSNRLQSRSDASTTTYSYDAAGHLTGDGVRTYGYDGRGRLVTVTNGAATNQYLIDGLGQRVSKSGSQVAGGRNWFVYDEAGHLIGEYGASGAVIIETVWLDSMPVGALKPGAVSYVYPDHLGAPWTIASQSSTTVWAWNRDPFGNGAPTGSFAYNLRFPGQYFDKETGLFYNYYRDYDPSTGRYVQSDPLGLAGGINTYAYVGGNPLKYADQKGLQVWQPALERFVDWAEEDGPIIIDQLQTAWSRVLPYVYQTANAINQNPWLGGMFGYGITSIGAEEVPELYEVRANTAEQYGAMAARLWDTYEKYEQTHGESPSTVETPLHACYPIGHIPMSLLISLSLHDNSIPMTPIALP